MHVLTAGDITAPSMPIVGCANSTAEIYELLELLRDEVRQPCAHRFAASRPVVDHLWRACGRAGRRHHGLRRGPVPAHMAMALFVTAPRLRRLHAAVGGGGGAGGAPRVPPPQPQRDSHAVVSRAPMQLLFCRFWSREQPVQPPSARSWRTYRRSCSCRSTWFRRPLPLAALRSARHLDATLRLRGRGGQLYATVALHHTAAEMLVVAGWRPLGLRSHMDRPGQRRGSINCRHVSGLKGQRKTEPASLCAECHVCRSSA